jgi:hypothetical protein
MSQPLLRTFFYGTLGLAFLISSVSAKVAPAITLDATGDEITVILRQTAMPKMSQDRLGSILTRCYNVGFGGPDNWEKLVSLRISGRLTVEAGEFEFNSYQKKPHYLKMTINGPRGALQAGYDGNVAWQVLASDPAAPDPAGLEMDAAHARRFIHSAYFGNHLLYPYALGKQIEYLDTVPVDGAICHQIRVTLKSGFQVDYFVDIRTYLESKTIMTDLRTGEVSETLSQDYFREFGIPVARKMVRSENGVWVSTFELDKITVNSGVMPWMFKMPK